MGLGQGWGRPGAHLVGEINLLLAVHLLADAALLGQLLQRLHHGLREAGGQQGPAPRPVRPSQAQPGPARPAHRLAQPVLPLQVPENVLGAVGAVLLPQVPQQDGGGS